MFTKYNQSDKERQAIYNLILYRKTKLWKQKADIGYPEP